jgi:TPR repeat protein
LDRKIAEMPEPPLRPDTDFTRAHILRAEACLLEPLPAPGTSEEMKLALNRHWGISYLRQVPDHSALVHTLWSDYRFLADDVAQGNDLLWKSSNANEPAALRRTYGAAVAEQWQRFAYFGKNSVAGVQEVRALPPIKEALDHLRKLVTAGDRWAARLLATHYRHASNHEHCIHWNSIAANLGDGGACIELAENYLTGEHVPRDLKLAQQWADKGMRISASHAYIRDRILPQLTDPDGLVARERKQRMDTLQGDAVKEANRTGNVAEFLNAHPRLAREAAQSGDPLLALCYLRGHGVLADRQRAVGLVRSGEGGAVALYVLARIYETAEPPDHSGALVCYDSAVAAGHAFGMLGRARHLRDGNAIKKDDAGAADLFKQAAEAGCLPAMVEYAKCLRDGTGVEADKAEATTWAKKAADQDWQPAKQLLKELEQ